MAARPGAGNHGQLAELLEGALVNAEDRQVALDEVCREALKGFVGRKLTPTLVAQAEIVLRASIRDAIAAGKYVLPPGLEIRQVALGSDMRIKVLFQKVGPVILDEKATISPEQLSAALEREEKLKSRFEAVAAELGYQHDPPEE